MSGAVRAPGKLPPERKRPLRQRQHLIDACISALHVYGPSRTTVEKVVAIADLSPGIVRFYFDSKAAMLVAALQFLATEFEERVLAPVAALKLEPVAALHLMVELFLDPDIASARKVSVWYAFWGEATSRQEYYDICGHIDERFALLVHELIGALVAETRQPQLDPDGIALGLIGVLEILWQDIAFQAERDIDRVRARRRCLAYLRSVFPGRFAAAGAAAPHLAGGIYDTPRVFTHEREALFRDAWLFVGHESQIPREGDFLTGDTGVERALVVRGAAGGMLALRNSCPEMPHALVTATAGHLEGDIECRRHGLTFSTQGRCSRQGGADLTRLEFHEVQGLIFVRSSYHGDVVPSRDISHSDSQGGAVTRDAVMRSALPWNALPEGLMPLGAPWQAAVAADWKVVVEMWLGGVLPGCVPPGCVPPAAPPGAADLEWEVSPAEGWSAMRHRALVNGLSDQVWRRRYAWPSQLIETRPDGLSVIQVVPVAAGRCRVRRFDYTRLSPGAAAHETLTAHPAHTTRRAHAAAYLAQRLGALSRRSNIAMAESIQQGLSDLGYEAAAAAPPAVVWFRAQWGAALPPL